jgi:hypothetical protein
VKLSDTLQKLEQVTKGFKFGHTPMQIEYFQTINQQGNEKFEYFQHILQLRSLYTTLAEMKITYDEIEYEIKDTLSFWPIWNKAKRKRSYPRLKFKLESIQRSIDEKSREVEYHLDVIEKKFSHLKNLKETDILADETGYWTLRLSRQLASSHLSRLLGVSESELLAVLALPNEQQKQIFDSMKQLLGQATVLLPSKELK